MKLTATRFTLVALVAASVGIAVALIVYVALLAGVLFLALTATGAIMAWRQKRRLPLSPPAAPRQLDRP